MSTNDTPYRDMTDSEIERRIKTETGHPESLRSDLADKALDLTVRPDRLADFVNDLARAETLASLWRQVDGISKRDEYSAQDAVGIVARQTIRSMIISGADDTWSGRTNDCKRAAFEGQRKFLDQIGYAG